MAKKCDNGIPDGRRCTSPGCRRKATTWNNIGPETGEPVCDTHEDRKRARKPGAMVDGEFDVAYVSAWGRVRVETCGDLGPRECRRLAAWLARAASWMEDRA